MGEPVTIVCAACGKGRCAEVTQRPQFDVDVAVIGEQLGFKYVFDMAYGRVVIFCSDECKQANITKRGHLRRNIIAPKVQQ